MDRWKGRVALVTGASSGIGAGICRELVKYDMTVIGCARRVQRIREIAQEDEVKVSPGRLIAIECDLTKESEIMSMFKEIRDKFGRIDVCINNAGVIFNTPLLTGKTQDWRTTFELNVLALCICTRESVKLMQEKGIDDGQIIQINSIGGHFVPAVGLGGYNIYSGTKFMVRALTEGLRRELTALKSHIRVESISPGSVKTEMTDQFLADNPEMLAEFSVMKILQPNDIADSVIHILKSAPHVDINEIILNPCGTGI